MNQSNVIECVKFEADETPLVKKIEQTYLRSFPENERRDFDLFIELVKTEPRFSVNVLLRDRAYVGFITAWRFKGFSYIEHFAIDEAARNEGIGGTALTQFLATCTQPVILEVELPVDEMSKRRIGFYERNGFILSTHPYVQPPYTPGGEWVDLQLMSYGNISIDKCYKQIKHDLYIYVYDI